MPTYTKLFNSIVTSSIWSDDDPTRILWITLLALSDKNGEIHAAVPGLARVAGISIEQCEKALAKFMSPDPYSRTPDDEGRRLEKIDGGWALINHAKYRDMASDEDRKTKAAERQKRYRERKARNAPVTLASRHNSHTDTEAEADKRNNMEGQPPCTLDQALSYAKTIGIYPDAAEVWFNTRDRDGWTVHRNNGNQTPITKNNWQKDLAQAKTWSCNKPPTKEPDAPEGTRRDGKIMVNGIWRKMT